MQSSGWGIILVLLSLACVAHSINSASLTQMSHTNDKILSETSTTRKTNLRLTHSHGSNALLSGKTAFKSRSRQQARRTKSTSKSKHHLHNGNLDNKKNFNGHKEKEHNSRHHSKHGRNHVLNHARKHVSATSTEANHQAIKPWDHKVSLASSGSISQGIPGDCSTGLPTLAQWRHTHQQTYLAAQRAAGQGLISDGEFAVSSPGPAVLIDSSKNALITTLLNNATRNHLPRTKAAKLLALLQNYSSPQPKDISMLAQCVATYNAAKDELVTKLDNDLFDNGLAAFLLKHRVQEKEQNFWVDHPAWEKALLFEHDASKLHLKFHRASNFIVFPRIFDFDYNTNTIVLEVVEGTKDEGEEMTYLPWAVDYVTNMAMFNGTTSFVTGPLDGCNVYVARKAGALPVVMHANANHHNPGFLFNTHYKYCRAQEVLRADWPGYEFTEALQRQDYCRGPSKCGYTFVWGSREKATGQWKFYRHFAQTGGEMDTSDPTVSAADTHEVQRNWPLEAVPSPPVNCAELLSKFL